ncbi:MFS transporter [Sulfobacillus thermosulfidooxidans]|uniref:MFS transporter n=1 Tax=Sulfobacillus thermosulfidooxidans TaxID=28034 RepID=UPI000401F402|nr:MFS transporter [Sulfobacillus thermosulfidooxidans]
MIASLRAVGFRWLWLGQLLSQFGNAVFLIMGFWVIQLKSPFLLGIAGLAMAIPQILAVIGGAVVDRFDAKQIMLLTDLLRGTAVAVGLVIIALDPQASPYIIITVIGVNALGTAFFGPAEAVVLPLLVPDQDLAAANGLYSLTAQMTSAIGAGIGGAAIATVGIFAVFGFDLVSFWFSALAIFIMTRYSRPLGQKPTVSTETKHPFAGFREGWKMITMMRWFVTLLPLILLTNFTFAGGLILLPYWVHHDLHSTAFWYGLTDGAWSLGMMIGSLNAGWLSRFSLEKTISVSGILQGSMMAAFAFTHAPGVDMVWLFIGGVCNGATNALIFTMLQRLIPEAIRGRTFGLLITIVTAATPLAVFLAGVSVSIIPTIWWYLAMAITDVAFGLSLWRVIPKNLDGSSGTVLASES